jgi:hypothetical protein
MTTAVTTTAAPAAPAATGKPNTEKTKTKDGKTSITITFGDKESAVFGQIVKDADRADRTEAKYLAIWLRDNYGRNSENPA